MKIRVVLKNEVLLCTRQPWAVRCPIESLRCIFEKRQHELEALRIELRIPKPVMDR